MPSEKVYDNYDFFVVRLRTEETYLTSKYLRKVKSTLFGCGVKRNRENENNSDCQSENGKNVDAEKPKAKRVRQTWSDSWYVSYPWIKKVNINGSVVAKCKWCIDAKRKKRVYEFGHG